MLIFFVFLLRRIVLLDYGTLLFFILMLLLRIVVENVAGTVDIYLGPLIVELLDSVAVTKMKKAAVNSSASIMSLILLFCKNFLLFRLFNTLFIAI